MTEVLWSRMTAAELREAAERDAIVLLPVASTEQHGPHLAVSVDVVLCGEACRRTALKVAAKRAVVVAPTVWMGLAEHHVALGGTFTLSLSTWHALLRDLCRSILRAGFGKILIVNGHGGNMAALAALTTDLTHELGAPIATTNYWTLPHDSGAYAKVLETQTTILHACEGETSMMLALAPDLVRNERLPEAHGPGGTMGSTLNQPLNVWRSFKDITTCGVRGDARRASAEKGKRLLEIASDLLAAKLVAGEPWQRLDGPDAFSGGSASPRRPRSARRDSGR
jgi:creatinine amidohydrolase